MINVLRAFRTGLVDGLLSPHDMSVGMSYPDDRRQNAWDYGANLGQRIGRLVAHVTRLWKVQP